MFDGYIEPVTPQAVTYNIGNYILRMSLIWTKILFIPRNNK